MSLVWKAGLTNSFSRSLRGKHTHATASTWKRNLVLGSFDHASFSTSNHAMKNYGNGITVTTLRPPFSTAGNRKHPNSTVFQDTLFSGNVENALRLLQTKTQALLDTPIGSWTVSQWRDSIRLLDHWTENDEAAKSMTKRRQRPKIQGRKLSKGKKEEEGFKVNKPKNTVSGTAQSVLSSFSLLERLLVEQQRNKECDWLAKEVIHTDRLNALVQNWSICWNENQLTSDIVKTNKIHGGDAEHVAKILLEYTPDNILSRINAYQMRSRGLLTPNKITFHTLAEGAAVSSSPSFAVKVLDRMASEGAGSVPDQEPNATIETTGSNISSGLLDPDTYFKFIINCSKMGDATQAEECLEHMYDQYIKTGNEDFKPTTKNFNAVLRAWAQKSDEISSNKHASERSQKILKRMVELSSPNGALEGSANPDYKTYSLVLKCMTNWLLSVLNNKMDNVKDYEFVGETAESLLDDMKDKFLSGGSRLRPDIANYNAVLFIWSQLGNVERAEAILERAYTDFSVYKNRLAEPNVTSFNCVLNAWINHQRAFRISSDVQSSMSKHLEETTGAGERAESIFRKMQELQQSGKLKRVKPNTDSFHAVIQCWAVTRSKEAGDRALALLREAKELEKETGTTRLRRASYGSVIQAYGAAGLAQEAERVATEFFRQFHEEGNEAAKPSMNNLTILLNAWAKSNHPNAPQRAETILHEADRLHAEGVLSEAPNTVSWTTIVECYSKSELPDAGERCEALLDEMNRRARNGETHVSPNQTTFRNVISAYATRGQVEKAEAVLEKMIQDFRRGNKGAKPNVKAFNLILTALSNSRNPNSAQKAFALLRRLEHMCEKNIVEGKPDVVTYTILLKCLANSNNQEAGKEAESLLDEMERRAAQGETSVAPNTLSYSTVIQIYGRAGNPERAEALLERMHRKFREGNKNVEANTRTFTSVLQAWSRSQHEAAPEKGLAILKQMKELHKAGVLNDIKPNAFTYAAVLGCIAKPRADEGTSKLAIELLDEMEQLGEANGMIEAVCYKHAMQIFEGDGVGAQQLLARMYHSFESGKIAAKPSLNIWNRVLKIWNHSDDPNAHLRVESIFHRIQELHKSGDLKDGPNAYTYLPVLECYARARVSREKIDPILKEILRLSVTDFSMYEHLIIIRSLCQMKDGELLVQAEHVLTRMLKECDRSSPKWSPNAVKAAYKALINAWDNSKESQASEYSRRLRHQMVSLEITYS